jgi:hypothetical protein
MCAFVFVEIQDRKLRGFVPRRRFDGSGAVENCSDPT